MDNNFADLFGKLGKAFDEASTDKEVISEMVKRTMEAEAFQKNIKGCQTSNIGSGIISIHYNSITGELSINSSDDLPTKGDDVALMIAEFATFLNASYKESPTAIHYHQELDKVFSEFVAILSQEGLLVAMAKIIACLNPEATDKFEKNVNDETFKNIFGDLDSLFNK
jgi:hypothetical protein